MKFISLLLGLCALLSSCVYERGSIVIDANKISPQPIHTVAQYFLQYDFLGMTSASSGGYVTNGIYGTGIFDGTFNVSDDIVIDSTGTYLYVVDTYNYRIQKILVSTGVTVGSIGKSSAKGTCIAEKQTSWCTGGYFSPGKLDGEFDLLLSMAIDEVHDRLYVGDNSFISKFVLSTGAFIGKIGSSTLSGTCTNGAQSSWCTNGVFSSGSGDGQFNDVSAIKVDPANNLMYVADAGNDRIQKFNLTTGAFIGAIGKSSASGTCVAGKQNTWCTGGVFSASVGGIAVRDGLFLSPEGIDIDVANNWLFVVDYNNLLQKFNLTTGAFISAIGNSNGANGTCVNGPQPGWCVGGLYFFSFADGGLWNPANVLVDSGNDRIYVSEKSTHRIQKFVLSTGAYSGTIGFSLASGTCQLGKQNGWCTGGYFLSNSSSIDGTFNMPGGLAIDSSSNRLFVSDLLNSRIEKFVLSTGAFVSGLGGLLAPNSSWSHTNEVGLANATTLESGFNSISGAVVDETSDRMYVVDNYRVQKFVLSTAQYLGSIGKSTASGTCVAGKQNSWCTGGVFSNGTGDGELPLNMSIAVDFTNNFLYTLQTNRVQKFNLTTGAYIGSIGNSTATGTCVAGKQNTWCTGGTFSTGSGDGMFNNPYGFAVDPVNDFFYVADYSNYRVQKFRLSTGQFIGSIGNSTLSGTCLLGKQSAWCTGGVFSSASGDGLFSNLKGIALDVDSNRLYVTNGINIQKFNLATGDFIEAIGKSTLSGSCVSGAQPSWCTGGNFSMGTSDGAFGFNNSIALDTENNKFYVTSNSDYRVQSFELSSGKFLGSIGYTTAASGTCALGIQNTWCTGGTFINGSNDGMFRSITHIAYADTKLYVFEYGRVQRITLP